MLPSDSVVNNGNDITLFIKEDFSSPLRLWCKGLNPTFIDPDSFIEKVISGVTADITVDKLYELAAETAGGLSSTHYDYSTLAARIAVSCLHRNTPGSLIEAARILYENKNPKTGDPAGLIADDVYNVIENNVVVLENAIKYERDFQYDYFGFKTLERQYLMRIGDRIVERPQHMLMRVSIGIHKEDIPAVLETYEGLSQRFFTHATPTLFNAGTPRPFLSSCFLVSTKSDSVEGIFDTLKECALISKQGGGIGLSIHDIRASGSVINNGLLSEAKGVLPVLKVFNNTARFIDLKGKRRSAIAVYMEPWHSDIFEFLDMRKNFGREDKRVRDLFNALWIPDLFMQRVETDAEWSLFCPSEAPGLADVWGDAFENLYTRYEKENRAKRVVRAQQLWFRILDAQIETGTPFMLYKDLANRKSNQQNLGTIRSSNLCAEIIEFTGANDTAVCNLASIALPKFVKIKPELLARSGGANGGVATNGGIGTDRIMGSLGNLNRYFDFQGLMAVTAVLTRNLNRVIDVGAYPNASTEQSNKRHRPIGIGIQGLADTFQLFGFPFDSASAAKLNRQIMEAIYYAALRTSCELAQNDGAYETYDGSPMSKGLLQPDLWGVTPSGLNGLADWAKLRNDIARFGVRNSLLVAPMPTASTSQILGNNECFEPYTSNIYVRRVLGGEFYVVNPHLIDDLCKLGLWSADLKEELIASEGSVQNIMAIPEHIRVLYKTVWEIKQRVLVDMAAERGAYIDQSQSLNIFMADPTFAKLTSLHFYTWRKGLKTGMYYLRTRAAAAPIKFTVDPRVVERMKSSATRRTGGTFAVPPPPQQLRANFKGPGYGTGGNAYDDAEMSGTQQTDDWTIGDEDGASEFSGSQRDSQMYKRAFEDEEDEDWESGSRYGGGESFDMGYTLGGGLLNHGDDGDSEASLSQYSNASGYGNGKRYRMAY